MLVKVGRLTSGVGHDPETYWRGPVEVAWSLEYPGHALPAGYVESVRRAARFVAPGQRKFFEDYIPPGPPDPAVVSAIRRFYPRYVPLWCTRVYISPDGLAKMPFTYHVIGRWADAPDPEWPDEGRIVRVLRPPGFPFRGGVLFEQRTDSEPWPDGSPWKAASTPDIPRRGPASWGLYWMMQEAFKEAVGSYESVGKLIERADAARRDADEREAAAIDAEADYGFKTYRNIYRKAVEEGRIFDEPREHEARPYAFMGLG